jgi:hypothetical protein
VEARLDKKVIELALSLAASAKRIPPAVAAVACKNFLRVIRRRGVTGLLSAGYCVKWSLNGDIVSSLKSMLYRLRPLGGVLNFPEQKHHHQPLVRAANLPGSVSL